jgi:hypothetical protein
MNYFKIILELIPKKSIAIYLLKKAKELVKKNDYDFDDLSYEILINLLIKVGFISENEAINEKL